MAKRNPSVTENAESSDASKSYLKRSKKESIKPLKHGSHVEDILDCDLSDNTNSDSVYSRPKTGFLNPAPFSDEPRAVLERQKCDYSIKITKEMIENETVLPRVVRVYSDGIYDLFHQGHARQLMQAKNAFSEVYLIVGVHDDHLTHKLKGKTVMTDQERYESVRHCRYVDEVYRAAPWVIGDEFIEENKIDFVAHDDMPYAMGSESGDGDVYHHHKVKGRFVATERTEGISTSDLISRVVHNYDEYADLGYELRDMKFSFPCEKRHFLQNGIDGLKRKVEECVCYCKKILNEFMNALCYFFTKEEN